MLNHGRMSKRAQGFIAFDRLGQPQNAQSHVASLAGLGV